MSDDLREVAVRVLIIVVAVTWLVILWRADRNPLLKNFSILGFITTRDGFPDRPGALEMGTWIAATLFMLILALRNHLTEWYLMVYIAFPAVRAGQVAWLHSGNPQPPLREEPAHEDPHEHG